jgi:NAD(P)-dependent dehydrogenase (short-subunit alcohol dehydrogenase family)
VVSVARAKERAEDGLSGLTGDGETLAVEADVGVAEDCLRTVGETMDRFGQVDVLVNCAGIRSFETDDPLTLAAEDWQRVNAVNVTGPLLLAQQVLPGMLERGNGAIVNIVSVAALVSGHGAGYVTTKHALLGLTRELGARYSRHGLRINAISPGFTDTPMFQSFFATAPPEAIEMVKGLVETTPAGRVAAPEEIANAVAFVASEEASFICGATIDVDGGYTLI